MNGQEDRGWKMEDRAPRLRLRLHPPSSMLHPRPQPLQALLRQRRLGLRPAGERRILASFPHESENATTVVAYPRGFGWGGRVLFLESEEGGRVEGLTG